MDYNPIHICTSNRIHVEEKKRVSVCWRGQMCVAGQENEQYIYKTRKTKKTKKRKRRETKEKTKKKRRKRREKKEKRRKTKKRRKYFLTVFYCHHPKRQLSYPFHDHFPLLLNFQTIFLIV